MTFSHHTWTCKRNERTHFPWNNDSWMCLDAAEKRAQHFTYTFEEKEWTFALWTRCNDDDDDDDGDDDNFDFITCATTKSSRIANKCHISSAFCHFSSVDTYPESLLHFIIISSWKRMQQTRIRSNDTCFSMQPHILHYRLSAVWAQFIQSSTNNGKKKKQNKKLNMKF